MITNQLLEIAKKIKVIILDVDGVLTDGRIYFLNTGEQMVSFHVHDGLGIKLLQECGITVAVISSRNTLAVQHRLRELAIQHTFLGQHDKLKALDELLMEVDCPLKEIAYVGDDLPDIAVMQKVGLPVAVANAVKKVRQAALYCTQKKGGKGAVREVCDLIYSAIHA